MMNGCFRAVWSALFMIMAGIGYSEEKPDPAWGVKLDWRHGAKVETLPAIQNAAALADGDVKTTGVMAPGGEAGAEIAFQFFNPTEVSIYRFVQVGRGASQYQLWADLDGSGRYADLVLDKTDETPIKNEWIVLPVNKKVYGLKFIAVAGEIGFRNSFPIFAEIEIYGKERLPNRIPTMPGALLEMGASRALPPLDRRGIDIRICTDTWNYSLDQWYEQRQTVPLGKWEPYKKLVLTLKELDANSVRLFDETLCGRQIYPFSTSLVPEANTRDYLRPLTQELKKSGYNLYYFTHAWKIPFQIEEKMAPMPWRRWDYPYHQSDTIVGLNEKYTQTYPCVLCSDDFRTKWTQQMRDALKAGAAGIYLMPDEYFFKGHNLSRCTCQDCRREFKAMFGFDDLPKMTTPTSVLEGGYIGAPPSQDSEIYRKWKLFEYIKLSDLFKRVSADLKKEFPQAKFINNDNQAAFENSLSRLENTIASDIIGTDPNADYAQVYGNAFIDKPGQHSAFWKRFEASAGRQKLLASVGWPIDPACPAEAYDHILSEVFLGSRILEVYRLNYIFERPGSAAAYKKAFQMVRLLEKWDLQQSEIPAQTCMLLNRAGEDWYYVKVSSMMNADQGQVVDFYLHLADESINKVIQSGKKEELQRFLAQERLRGISARMTMESLLTGAGIPYKVAYTERPDNMTNLSRYKLIVVPFAYSLSQSAAEELKKAADKGTKIVIFDQLAPTDEFGTELPAPRLRELTAHENVKFIPVSLAQCSADAVTLNQYRILLEKYLPEDSYRFSANGQPVNYLVSAFPGDRGYLIYLCNLGTQKARPVFALPAQKEYQMEVYSSDTCQLNGTTVNQQPRISAETLRKGIAVDLDPQEVKLIRVY